MGERMKKILLLSMCLLSGCASLSYVEETALKSLSAEGITPDKPAGGFENPANPVGAGALNLLPGVGNFYLATGNGADKDQFLYGFLNLATWPLSITWGIPQSGIDAITINEKEFVHFYMYNPNGKHALAQRGLYLGTDGILSKTNYGGYNAYGYQQPSYAGYSYSQPSPRSYAPYYQPYY